jgi:hypothetical protein
LADRLAAPVVRHDEIEALSMFAYTRGHEQNLYTSTGIPRTHNAWEMQLLTDDGLLFMLYERCCDAVRRSASRAELRAAFERLSELLDSSDPAALRQRAREWYASHIADFLCDGRAPLDRHFECIVLRAYILLAVSCRSSTFTLDLFPAHTGPDNVSEGLKGLVSHGRLAGNRPRVRSFWCSKAESYTRYYGINLAKQLNFNSLRFSLVVPFANGVRHIALTRGWPIDGAENIARYIEQIRSAWVESGHRAHPPKILVSGYSQGGAAVRLFDEALRGGDVIARAHFRGYSQKCHALKRLRNQTEIPIHTVSIATMGGIDGVGFSERHPQWIELAEDQRGAAGVHARANAHGGLHLAICHDFDPARWVLPGSLTNLVGRLLKFGGPELAFHGGAWTRNTESAFEHIPAAKALIDDVSRNMISSRFVDEHRYADDRCTRAAFPHLVVGTLGYPGWVVVEKFVAALTELEAGRTELLHESSWCCDILPEDQPWSEVVARAMIFHRRQQQRASAVVAKLERSRSSALAEHLRGRFLESGRRRHMLEYEHACRPRQSGRDGGS